MLEKAGWHNAEVQDLAFQDTASRSALVHCNTTHWCLSLSLSLSLSVPVIAKVI